MSHRPTPEELAEKGLCRAYQFKDDVCGYDGPETWCDKTEARCAGLKNSARFDCALPPIVRPYMIPWWSISCTLGMIATMMFVNNWTCAGILYVIFSLLLIPPARMALYYRYVHPIRCRVLNKDTSEDN